MRPHTNMLPLDYKTAREASLRVEPTGRSRPLTSPALPRTPPLSPTEVPSVTTSPPSNKRSYDQYSHTSQACPANSPVSQAQSSPDTNKSALLRHPDASPLWARTPSTNTSPQNGINIPHRPLRGTQRRAPTNRGDDPPAFNRVLQPTDYQVGQSTRTTQAPRVILPFRALPGSNSMDYNSKRSKYPTAQAAAEPCGHDSKVWDLQTKTIQESSNALPRGNKRRRLA